MLENIRHETSLSNTVRESLSLGFEEQHIYSSEMGKECANSKYMKIMVDAIISPRISIV